MTLDQIADVYERYGRYLIKSFSHPFEAKNYLAFFLLASLVVWGLEIAFPWRKKQRVFRKGFWQDTTYIFLNLIFFNLLFFVALSSVTADLFGKLMGMIGLPSKYVFDLKAWPQWLQLLTFFLLYDFLQWCIHNALHRIPFLWKFHRLHHSATQMSFAAHFRFHFAEVVFYKIGLFIVISYLFHFKLVYGFYIYAGATLIGHLNHANLGWDYGPLKYILNNPKMHIWHHAKELSGEHPKGANFGLSLSIWDYIFGTNYIPSDGQNIDLGFENIETYPDKMHEQLLEPFRSKKREDILE